MNDRPRGDGAPGDGTPDYKWLYGGAGAPEPGSPDGPAGPADDERTRAVPRQPRQPRPDETRVMPAMARPTDGGDRPRTGQRSGERSGTPPTPPPLAPTPGSDRPRRRRGFRFYLRLVLVLLLLWVVYLVVVPVWAWKSVKDVEFEPSGDRPADQPGTTYLLVGSDSRAGLTKAQRKEYATGNVATDRGRTDTIMLLHTGSGPNLLMSLPRDSIVDVPGHGSTKINAAFAYGGPKLLVKTIEQNTGIRVDQYVEIGLGGLAGVVDAVGGIQICPERNMKDKLAGLNVKKGCQEADGRTALAYSRSRHSDPRYGDITRVKHQREVVAAVGDKVVSPWTVLNPFRYWNLAHAVPDFFAFGQGMGVTKAAAWASAMTKVTGSSGKSCVVPISDLAVHWDPKRSKQMFGYIKEDKVGDMPASLCTPTGLPKSVTG